jgi:MoaA/NifB/PqqE/SkfB family radical SAM enzyme
MRARGVRVAIISNAGAIGQSLAENLASRRVSYVQVTLLGPNAEIHDSIAGPGTFHSRVKGIKRLVSAGVPVGAAFICARTNSNHAADTYKLFRNLSAAAHFVFMRFNPSGYGAESIQKLLPRLSDVKLALSQVNSFAAEQEIRVYNKMPIPLCMIEESD